jgi:hypothetical protein
MACTRCASLAVNNLETPGIQLTSPITRRGRRSAWAIAYSWLSLETISIGFIRESRYARVFQVWERIAKIEDDADKPNMFEML